MPFRFLIPIAFAIALSSCAASLSAASPATSPAVRTGRYEAADFAPLIAQFDESPGFSGVVLVARGDEILVEKAYGDADRARGVANTPATRFNLASVGKIFTAVAVMQLVEQGKLALDAPVGRYLPDYANATVRDRVTVRHLLTHTSGLGSYWGPAFAARRTQLRTVADHFALFENAEPSFDPGSRWQYSNVGYLLLGRLIEVASGEDFHAYVAKHVFARAGMHDSGFYDANGEASGVAIGYGRAAPGADVVEDTNLREWRGGPAGGGYSSARDLLRFTQALLRDRLLSPESTRALLAVAPVPGAKPLVANGGRTMGPPSPETRGLGIDAVALGDDVVIGHGGGFIGAATEWRALRDDGLTVVVLSNLDVPQMQRPLIAGYRALADAGLPDLSVGLPIPRRAGREEKRAVE